MPRFNPPARPGQSPQDAAPVALTLEEIERDVEAVLSSRRFQPPLLPEVAMRLSRLVEAPDSDVSKAEAVVASDPSVAARVVAQANSVALRGRVEITSLRAAVGRLGLVRVRDVAFQVVAAGKVFRVPVYTARVEQLLDASQLSGALATMVAKAQGLNSPAASLCGLLHDMGEPIVLGVVADVCKARRASLPEVEALTPIVERWHAPFGALVCSAWKLPDVTIDAVAHHHDLRSALPGGLAGTMAVVDLLLRHVGVGKPWQPVTKADLPVLEAAALPVERMGPLLRQAEDLAAAHASSSSAA